MAAPVRSDLAAALIGGSVIGLSVLLAERGFSSWQAEREEYNSIRMLLGTERNFQTLI